jgi:hypothetical protein
MALGSTSPFRPAGSVSVAATTVSATSALAGGGESVVVTNNAASLAFVRFGSDSTVSASSADMPVLPNSRAMLSVNSLIGFVAVTLASGSGNVFFTRGDGSFV